jgi:hypothetical protein
MKNRKTQAELKQLNQQDLRLKQGKMLLAALLNESGSTIC